MDILDFNIPWGLRPTGNASVGSIPTGHSGNMQQLDNSLSIRLEMSIGTKNNQEVDMGKAGIFKFHTQFTTNYRRRLMLSLVEVVAAAVICLSGCSLT